MTTRIKVPYLRCYGCTELGNNLFHPPWTHDKDLLEKSVGKPVVTPDFKYRLEFYYLLCCETLVSNKSNIYQIELMKML